MSCARVSTYQRVCAIPTQQSDVLEFRDRSAKYAPTATYLAGSKGVVAFTPEYFEEHSSGWLPAPMSAACATIQRLARETLVSVRTGSARPATLRPTLPHAYICEGRICRRYAATAAYQNHSWGNKNSKIRQERYPSSERVRAQIPSTLPGSLGDAVMHGYFI